MQEALSHVRIMGEMPENEHIARQSALLIGNINMPGDGMFTLPEGI